MMLLSEHSVTSLDVVHCGDALAVLRTLPDQFVQCIVTSPPYYGLRDYGSSGQIGLEDTPAAYVARLVAVLREARRVLRDDGVAWINLGDSYAANRTEQVTPTKWQSLPQGQSSRVPTGLKPKDLFGIPWRVAFALQDDGWWLRSDIIWHKPNPMPESVTDRPTKAHEYVFLLAKAERYWYDAEAVREQNSDPDRTNRDHGMKLDASRNDHYERPFGTPGMGRNRRTVWTVPTEPKPFQHFAMFPQALIEPMVLAGCPAQACAVCGAPWVRVVEREANYEKRQDRGQPNGKPPMVDSSGWKPATVVDNGFAPTCTCHADTAPGVVLDPFMGSGTTALVAQRLGRRFVGIELNPEYVELARQRVAYRGDDARMVREQEAGVQQLSLAFAR